MKIRDGFVSNSSSSSFVVRIHECEMDALLRTKPGDDRTPKQLVDDKKIDWLEKYGFKFSRHVFATAIEFGVKPKKVSRKNATHMYFSVIVNQDEVIEDLVNHGIHFSAACHHGHEMVFYRIGSDELVQVPNPGLFNETYTNEEKLEKHYLLKTRRQKVEDVIKNGFYPE